MQQYQCCRPASADEQKITYMDDYGREAGGLLLLLCTAAALCQLLAMRV
jgi:hypothetical protein